MLRYQSVSRNKVAISEFAALVVAYERLEKEEQGRGTNEAKRRELGLKKVALYDKYNLSLFMLKVPKSKMPQYQAFLRNFWSRVDEFKRNNPGIKGPGPFTLPREGRLASLSNGAQTLVKSVLDNMSVQEAVADDAKFEKQKMYVRSDYPRCKEFENGLPKPLPKCENGDDEMFYFEKIVAKNFQFKGAAEPVDGELIPYEGIYTMNIEWYLNKMVCEWDPSSKRRMLKGDIYRQAKEENEICGSNSGDASGEVSKWTSWLSSAWGTIAYRRYCLDSNHPEFEVYKKGWTSRGIVSLTTEPKWCDE